MPDLKISQLPVATTPLAGTELVPIVQGGVTDRTTVQAIMTSTVPSGTANGVLYLNATKVATSGSALTFDGTKFYVNTPVLQGSTNNYGGYAFQAGNQNGLAIRNAGDTALSAWFAAGDSAGLAGAGDYAVMSGQSGAIFGIGNSEQMRLTSTGLGIGTTPTNKLTVNSGATTTTAQFTSTGSSVFLGLTNSGASAFIGADNTGAFLVQTPGSGYSTKLFVDTSGNLIQTAPTTPPTLSTNGTMVFNLTSNTNLRVSVRGSDGVTRVANLTLA